MNEKLVKQALQTLADRAISANDDPRQVVRTYIAEHRLAPRAPTSGKMLRPRLAIMGAGLTLLILAGMFFLLTPPGQVLAQNIVRFFTFAESDELPLSTLQTEALPATRTAAPTRFVTLEEVTPLVAAAGLESYPTATMVPPAGTGEPIWNLNLDEASQMAGFIPIIPTVLPPGYRLDNVIFDPATGEISQFYGFHPYSAGETFILNQRRSQPDDVIGQSALVEKLTIGGVAVEYVEGGWFDSTGSGVETWQTDSLYHTFRWRGDEFYFTLTFMFDDGDTWSPAYWTPEDMQAMVEIIIGVRSELPERVDYNNLTSIEQAESAAGFELLVPSILPEGYIFSRAVYDPQALQVILFYQPEAGLRDTSGVQLLIFERPSEGEPPVTYEGLPPEAVEMVTVGQFSATFIHGALVDGVYDADMGLFLRWEANGLSIQMRYTTPAAYPDRLDRDRLIAIAESME